ncbi:MAG: hypothetical protein EAZ35_08585 [Sphingobacteriia bacterium]|nr:MAG: hypothetical protein EAZ35_08585 [Sphingobacteriia bacterium]
MLITAYYLLQVLLCSGIMMGYYWLVLRDKKFHQYNRFYLLAITLLAWAVPLIKIQWNQSAVGDDTIVYNLLSAVAMNNTEIEANIHKHWYDINWQMMATIGYITVSSLLFLGMFNALFKIYRLLKTHAGRTIGDIFLVATYAKGTPFSFFSFIFWNEAIDIKSESGKQILQHELIHVRQKHSIDKLFMQLVLVFGWFNPFFWAIRKELHMIHEFIADKKCVDDGNAAALAEMLLTAAFPQQKFLLSNPFFFSPIKRRITMIKNNNNPRFSYLRRLIVLPLLAMVVVLFAFRNAAANNKPLSVETVLENIYNRVADKKTAIGLLHADLSKTYTIVLNAAHGGADKGAIAADGSTHESELTLQLAKQIRDLNQNNRIRIVMTRDADIDQSVAEVAEIANNQKGDLFISLHYNSARAVKVAGKMMENPAAGMEIFIANPAKTNRYDANLFFANQIANKVDQLSIPFTGIRSRKEGIYVLQHVNSPSILLEAGYISNANELNKIIDPIFQQELAVAILNGIQQYLLMKEQGKNKVDTIILSADSIYKIPKDVKVKIIRASGNDTLETYESTNRNNKNPLNNALIVLNGVVLEKGKNTMANIKLNPSHIKRMNILKDSSAIALYGDLGKDGVIEIFTKQPPPPPIRSKVSGAVIENLNKDDLLFSATEQPAAFVGGKEGWTKYLENNLNRSTPVEKGGPPGKYTVLLSFIVDKQGNISKVKALNDPGYGTAAEAVKVIAKGPKWIPAKQNGKNVASLVKRTITYVVTEE